MATSPYLPTGDFWGAPKQIDVARCGWRPPHQPRSERAVSDGCRNGNGATAAILNARANRTAQKCGAQESKQRGYKTAKQDRSAHHPETER
jgi:hypothetical protein